jgi:hypothetical protein
VVIKRVFSCSLFVSGHTEVQLLSPLTCVWVIPFLAMCLYNLTSPLPGILQTQRQSNMFLWKISIHLLYAGQRSSMWPRGWISCWWMWAIKSQVLPFLMHACPRLEPCIKQWRPIGLWDIEASTLSRQSAHRRQWGCQPYVPVDCPLTPPRRFLVLIFVRGCVDPRATVWLEGIVNWKIQ